ncbi:MAG: DUF2914 domain-containing protein [Candidatus Pacebacteria bacterium]|nr:DUF2914 domain-containing protein [Candidatus Paceibacterota bacterium]
MHVAWYKQMFYTLRRHISSVAFVAGFVWDTWTLTRIDAVYDNTVFVSYLVLAFTAILLVHSLETGKWAPAWLAKYKEWLPALIQFPLGGLFSGFVIFYTKSASLVTSWPFLALLIALFFGNEFFRRRYERLVFQMSVFYFTLTSYLILVTPVMLGTIGTSTFVLATLVSLFVVAILLQVVMRLFPELYRRSMRGMWFSLGGIFVGFHALYFTNSIPPVPLALTEIGVYHSVVRTDGNYRVRFEQPQRYAFWRSTDARYHRAPGEAAYCFSSIFAPTALRTKVYHSWQRKTADGVWVREERVGFPVVGGRDNGYRGYTIRANLTEGDWRCVVEIENGQVIGETRFTVIAVDKPTAQVEGVR